MSNTTDLSQYDNSWYNTGANIVKRTIWYFTNAIFFKSHLFPFIGIKRCLLRIFGAQIGRGVVIKPGTNIKYPWFLCIGNDTWIGEDVWIDNLMQIVIGSNVCISQGAMLLCGNHNYKTSTFDLIIKSITIEDGAWVGAKATVCPGVTMHTHSILTVGSVTSKDLEPYSIYRGNPAIKIADREISSLKPYSI